MSRLRAAGTEDGNGNGSLNGCKHGTGPPESNSAGCPTDAAAAAAAVVVVVAATSNGDRDDREGLEAGHAAIPRSTTNPYSMQRWLGEKPHQEPWSPQGLFTGQSTRSMPLRHPSGNTDGLRGSRGSTIAGRSGSP